MQFNIKTLVDVTETNARRGDGNLYKQHQNFMTLLQTIGIRANPSNIKVVNEKQPITGLGFGTKFKGSQKVWTVTFEIEYGATETDFLETDFDLVPVNINLDETAKFEKGIFFTKDKQFTNIIFNKLDK